MIADFVRDQRQILSILGRQRWSHVIFFIDIQEMFPDELFPRCLSVKFYSKCKLEDEKSPLAEHIYIRIKIILYHGSSSGSVGLVVSDKI